MKKRFVSRVVKLYPNVEQQKKMAFFVGCNRWVYNWGLTRWGELFNSGQKVNGFILLNELVILKKNKDLAWLNDAIAQSLQQSLIDLNTAFNNFFNKRAKYPRFKLKYSHDSFRIPQCFKVDIISNCLWLPKLGNIPLKGLNGLNGKIKNVTVFRRADMWYASLMFEEEFDVVERKDNSIVGIDVGIKHLLTVNDGNQTIHYDHNPKLKELYDRLIVLQKQASHKTKGSNNQKKAYKRIAKLHKRITDMRNDTLHKASRDICKNHAFVCVEDLKILNMSKSASGTIENPGKKVAQKRGLNRGIRRQGWGEFFRMLQYKAQETGSHICIMDARFTSQQCPSCLHTCKENRPTQALFKCVSCGYSDNADAVAAINLRGKLTPEMLAV